MLSDPLQIKNQVLHGILVVGKTEVSLSIGCCNLYARGKGSNRAWPFEPRICGPLKGSDLGAGQQWQLVSALSAQGNPSMTDIEVEDTASVIAELGERYH